MGDGIFTLLLLFEPPYCPIRPASSHIGRCFAPVLQNPEQDQTDKDTGYFIIELLASIAFGLIIFHLLPYLRCRACKPGHCGTSEGHDCFRNRSLVDIHTECSGKRAWN